MQRAPVAILLILVLTASLMLKLSAIIWYEVNQGYIATELCLQKDVVDNSCAGHCQLNQKFELSDNTGSKSDLPVVHTQFEQLTFIVNENDESPDTYKRDSLTYLHFWTIGNEQSYSDEIDHPPAV